MRLRFLSLLALSLVSLMLAATPASAVRPDEMLADPHLEARARQVSEELRCLVCRNQSIDDSDADLAHDLRVLVRQRIKQGDSDQQVLDFLVARYGEFILLRPRLAWHTAVLWFGPPTLLFGGAIVLFLIYRRRQRDAKQAESAEKALTAAEQSRLARLLQGSER